MLVNRSGNGSALTRDDLINNASTIYDAYVTYADEDSDIAREFAQFLESPKFGLKLFIRGRDMLAGCPELDTNIELIKHRCRHMLILLTSNFIKSSASEFPLSFAGSLAIDQKQKILIPVVLSPCEIPPILFNVSKIDLTKEYTKKWMLRKLITSLKDQGTVANSSPFTGLNQISTPCMASNFHPSAAAQNEIIIAYSQTLQHGICLMNHSNTTTSITSEDTPINGYNDAPGASRLMENTTVYDEMNKSAPSSSKKSSNFFRKFMSNFKKRRKSKSSSNAPISSSANCEYNNLSFSSMNNFESSNDTKYTTL